MLVWRVFRCGFTQTLAAKRPLTPTHDISHVCVSYVHNMRRDQLQKKWKQNISHPAMGEVSAQANLVLNPRSPGIVSLLNFSSIDSKFIPFQTGISHNYLIFRWTFWTTGHQKANGKTGCHGLVAEICAGTKASPYLSILSLFPWKIEVTRSLVSRSSPAKIWNGRSGKPCWLNFKMFIHVYHTNSSHKFDDTSW